jgi:hypothetical protein
MVMAMLLSRCTDNAWYLYWWHGFDHGAGHPLLFLDDAKVPNCRKNNGFMDLGNYSEWPKVAGAVIKAGGTMSKFDIEGVQELGAKINVELGLGRHLFAQRPRPRLRAGVSAASGGQPAAHARCDQGYTWD